MFLRRILAPAAAAGRVFLGTPFSGMVFCSTPLARNDLRGTLL
jgi:hypothetical protein